MSIREAIKRGIREGVVEFFAPTMLLCRVTVFVSSGAARWARHKVKYLFGSRGR